MSNKPTPFATTSAGQEAECIRRAAAVSAASLIAQGIARKEEEKRSREPKSLLGISEGYWKGGEALPLESSTRQVLVETIYSPSKDIPDWVDFSLTVDGEACGILHPTASFEKPADNYALGLDALSTVPALASDLIRYEKTITPNFTIEVWSPNACRSRQTDDWKFLGFFPGFRPDLEIGEPLAYEAMYASGIQGKYDHTVVPQVFESRHPWRAFILIQHSYDAKGPELTLEYPEHLSIMSGVVASKEEVSAEGSITPSLQTALKLRARALGTLMQEWLEEKPNIRIQYGNYLPSVPYDSLIEELLDPVPFAQLVTRYARVVAQLKEVAGFCRFAEAYPEDGISEWFAARSSKELISPAPFAIPQLMGCWAYKATQAEFFFLVHALVPVYCIGMVENAVPKPPSVTRSTLR